MPSITGARARAQLDAITTALDAGAGAAIMRTYSGSVPANLDTALSGQTVLSENTMTTPNPFGSATGSTPASMSAAAISNDTSANASGTPTFCRFFDSDLNPVLQLSAGVGSGEVNFLTAITAGQPVQVTSITVNQPVA